MILSYIQWMIILDGWLRLFQDCISHLDGFSKWGCNIFQTSQTTKTLHRKHRNILKSENILQKGRDSWKELTKKLAKRKQTLVILFLDSFGRVDVQFGSLSNSQPFPGLHLVSSQFWEQHLPDPTPRWKTGKDHPLGGNSCIYHFSNLKKNASLVWAFYNCQSLFHTIGCVHIFWPYLLGVAPAWRRQSSFVWGCVSNGAPWQCLCTSKRSERSRATLWVSCQVYKSNYIDNLQTSTDYVILITWLYWMSCFALE